MKKLNLTKGQESEICDLYYLGLSSRKIAEKIGISNTSIRRILNRNNINMRSNKTDIEIEKKIINDYIAGKSSEKIAKEKNLDPCTICRILKRNDIEIRSLIENHRKHKIDFDLFKKIDTEEKAYFLGFMLADGNVHKRGADIKVCLHKKDKHILEEFSKMIYGKIVLFDDRLYPTFLVSCKTYKEDLAKYGLVPAKTLITRFPFNVNKELYRHIIRGLIDGDGGYSIKYGPCVSFTGTLELIKDIEKILLDMGIKINIQKERCKADNIYRFIIKKYKDVKMITKYLYKDSSIYLKRKKDIVDEISKFLEDKKVFDDDELREMWNKNYSISKISNIICSHPGSVRKRFIDLGLMVAGEKDSRNIKHNVTPVSKDKRDRVVSVYRKNLALGLTAGILDVSVNYVRKILKENNIEIKNHGLTPKQIKDINKYNKKGLNEYDIAGRTGLSAACIKKHMK